MIDQHLEVGKHGFPSFFYKHSVVGAMPYITLSIILVYIQGDRTTIVPHPRQESNFSINRHLCIMTS